MDERLPDQRIGAKRRIAAVLSDIHSNYHAFRACFDDAVKCGAEDFFYLFFKYHFFTHPL